MRAILTSSIGVAITTAVLTVLAPFPAQAGTKCTQVDPLTGTCTVSVEAPVSSGTSDNPGPKDTGSGTSCYWDPVKQGLKGPPAGPVSCTSTAGYWSNVHGCYVNAMHPQPPAGDPSWRGHQPGDGAVYICYQPQTDLEFDFWSAAPPPRAGAGPSPRAVAELAVKQMALHAIDIGIAPKPGRDSIGLVGMPVWMWAKAPDSHTVGPVTASAAAGGIQVTATARLLRITWSMGDGDTVVCRTAGTPYTPSYGQRMSPNCGYSYMRSSANQPGQRYTVTATSEWVIDWSGAGQRGVIRLGGLTRSTQIRIGEAQVLVS